MTTLVNEIQPVSAVRKSGLRRPLLAYFLIAFLGTWALLWPLALSKAGTGLLPFEMPDVLFLLIFFGSAFTGPALAAVVVTSLESGRAGVKELLRRIVLWRVGIHWYAIALLSILSVWLAAYSLVYRGMPASNFIQNIGLILPIFLTNVALGLLFPSLGEEPGWRGFALPRLQARFGPLVGTAILGFLHSFWHLPALFTPLLGPFTPERFLAFLITGTAATFIYTWIFNHTRGSILIAMLVHAASNAAASQVMPMVIPQDATPAAWAIALGPDWLNAISFSVAAVLLIFLTRGRLAYQGKDR
jgi:uncharacterized protein